MRTTLLVTAALAASIACGPRGTLQKAAPDTRPPAPTGSASLSGSVRARGVPPAAAQVRMGSDPACAALHPDGATPETFVIGDGGALANVVVRILSGLPEGRPPDGPPSAVLDQRGCIFTPHVMLARTGLPVVVRNSDATLHNVRVRAERNDSFNVGLPTRGQEVVRTFVHPEVLTIKCDVHPWMVAYVVVTHHPYVAVSDPSGRWRIDGLPAGSYLVEAWHEKLGSLTRRVELADGAQETLAFELASSKVDG